MTRHSILPYESYETGPLPKDLMTGYHYAVGIANAGDCLSNEVLTTATKCCLEDWSLLGVLAIGDVEKVGPQLSANAQEINSVRDHPVCFWEFTCPNAHLACFELWDRLLLEAWHLAGNLGLERGLCCEDRWEFDVFKLSVFKDHWKAARDYFANLRLPRTRHLLAELQLEVSKVARRRREAQNLQFRGEQPNPSQQEATRLTSATFAAFPSKQRTLLESLHDKRNVSISTVLLAVYGTRSNDNQQALAKLITRTNSKLCEKNLSLEISKEGETLILSAYE